MVKQFSNFPLSVSHTSNTTLYSHAKQLHTIPLTSNTAEAAEAAAQTQPGGAGTAGATAGAAARAAARAAAAAAAAAARAAVGQIARAAAIKTGQQQQQLGRAREA